MTYKPDESGVHQMYVLIAQKKAHEDNCLDELQGKVHAKEDADKLVGTLRELGFSVQLKRVSTTFIEDDPLPEEVDTEEA